MFLFSNCNENQPQAPVPRLLSTGRSVLPSDFLTESDGIMRGYNTYVDNGKLYSSVLGYVEQIDKLVCVNPAKSRYQPSIGDVVVGRVLHVTYKKWIVDIGAKQNAVLLLCSVILPGGEQRKKTHEDVITMSKCLSENDIILAEVQSVHSDGTPTLHMRSVKYGKLPVGMLIKVHHTLCYKSKNIINKMPDCLIILSSNGWIWIGPPSKHELDLSFLSLQKKYKLRPEHLEAISRFRNLIQILSDYNIPIDRRVIEVSIMAIQTYSTPEILLNENTKSIINKILSVIST